MFASSPAEARSSTNRVGNASCRLLRTPVHRYRPRHPETSDFRRALDQHRASQTGRGFGFSRAHRPPRSPNLVVRAEQCVNAKNAKGGTYQGWHLSFFVSCSFLMVFHILRNLFSSALVEILKGRARRGHQTGFSSIHCLAVSAAGVSGASRRSSSTCGRISSGSAPA